MKSYDRKPPREGWAKTPRLIWALGIGKTSKAVLAVLVSYDEEGLCWPSQETIRRDVTGSRRSVQRALDVLEGKPIKRGDKPLLETPAIGQPRRLPTFRAILPHGRCSMV